MAGRVLGSETVIRGVTNVFWAAFLADGLISVVAEALTWGGGDPVLGGFRTVWALLVVFFSLGVALMVAVTPRAPKRVLVPLLLFTWWAGLAQAFPLGFSKIPHLGFWLSVFQVVVAGVVFWLWRAQTSLRPFEARDRVGFAWKYALVAVPATAGVFLAVFVLGVFGAISHQISSSSGGYVQLRPNGLFLLERRFQSGDREVRLAGMMHIAEEEFYANLLPEADPKVPSVVLVEGVTDAGNLLGDGNLSYSGLARMLSISAQEDSSFMHRVSAGLRRSDESHPVREDGERAQTVAGGLDFVHADVDVGTFHPKTIAFIVAVMALFDAEDFPTLIDNLSKYSGPLNDETSQEQVMQDILYARNDRLVVEIQASLQDYRRVIIPWGALHLMGIESWLRTHDFEQSGETERCALRFW